MKKYTQENVINLLINQLQAMIYLTSQPCNLKHTTMTRQEIENSKTAIQIAQEFLNKEN